MLNNWKLPWSDFQVTDYDFYSKLVQRSTPEIEEILINSVPVEMRKAVKNALNLAYSQEPNYDELSAAI